MPNSDRCISGGSKRFGSGVRCSIACRRSGETNDIQYVVSCPAANLDWLIPTLDCECGSHAVLRIILNYVERFHPKVWHSSLRPGSIYFVRVGPRKTRAAPRANRPEAINLCWLAPSTNRIERHKTLGGLVFRPDIGWRVRRHGAFEMPERKHRKPTPAGANILVRTTVVSASVGVVRNGRPALKNVLQPLGRIG